MRPRDPGQTHRPATPLELLFDLVFVVAVSTAAEQLAQRAGHGELGPALAAYLLVFFAIWWAWMNFTWFASAYDTDDVPYRLTTLVQMAGALVLAAGVDNAFADGDFAVITVGYVVMRLAMVVQWLRAARSDPGHRRTARRYAGGITAVQLGWVARLLLPGPVALAGFLLLVLLELAVPAWAERAGVTPYHRDHIAERYGLFTLIVLGETTSPVDRGRQCAVRPGHAGAERRGGRRLPPVDLGVVPAPPPGPARPGRPPPAGRGARRGEPAAGGGSGGPAGGGAGRRGRGRRPGRAAGVRRPPARPLSCGQRAASRAALSIAAGRCWAARTRATSSLSERSKE